MAIVPVPAGVRFTDFEIWLDAASDEMKSVFNAKRQIAKLPYDVWNFRGDLVPLDPNEAGPVKSFLMKLAGRVNAFRLKIAGSKYPVSNYQGSNGVLMEAPAINGLYPELGQYVRVSGVTPNTNIINEGDYFNIGDELKVCTLGPTGMNGAGPAFSNAQGQVYIYFMPPLRNITLNQVVTITDPFLYLHATSDDVAKWSVKPPVRHAFKLDAEEEIV